MLATDVLHLQRLKTEPSHRTDQDVGIRIAANPNPANTHARLRKKLRTRRWLLAIALAIVTNGPAAAQPLGSWNDAADFSLSVQVDQADNSARSHLESVDRFLADGQWDEAIETLRRVMESSGEALMPVVDKSLGANEVFSRFVSMRDYCQLRLAQMAFTAPEALALYRRQVDPLAERWLNEAIERHDQQQLGRIVDSFFVSSFGDAAANRLAEMHLEQGHFWRARGLWARLIPPMFADPPDANVAEQDADDPVAGDADETARDAGAADHAKRPDVRPIGVQEPSYPQLIYPDTSLAHADIRARLVLCSILEGSHERAEWELEHFERLHADATGTIGGKRGKLAVLLQELLAASRSWPHRQPPPDWRTFAGSLDRNRIAASAPDPALRPAWTVSLPQRSGEFDILNASGPRVAEDEQALLPYHPLVVDDRVLLQTGPQISNIQAYSLSDGRQLWTDAGGELSGERSSDVEFSVDSMTVAGMAAQVGVPRFLMTADDRRLYAKLGPQAMPPNLFAGQEAGPVGFLVGLDLQAERKRLFEIRPEPPDWGTGWVFEGPPVHVDGKLFAAMRRRDNLRMQSHVACFEVQGLRAKLRWRRMIAIAETPGQGKAMQYSHSMLSLDQGLLFLNTNLGVVAAIEPESGDVRWVTRYPRSPLIDSDSNTSQRHFHRDRNPCVIYKGHVIAAPADCERIFCLDAISGAIHWTTERQAAVDAVHLLGVTGGRVIASGDRLYWIDLASGAIVSRFPHRVDSSLRGYGRGVMAAGKIYWPTRDKLYIFDTRDARQLRQPIDLREIGITGGNLVIADGVLLIATADRLVALNDFGRPLVKVDAN